MIKKILLIVLLFPQVMAAQQLSWPEISGETRPWTRWWWPGNIVNPTDISRNIETYRDAGLGGMEITAIYGVKGQEDKFINYLSPEFMNVLVHTLKEADRFGMGIDLANASGWPFGGPWVDPEYACRNINHKTYTLTGGQQLNEKIEFIQQALLRPVGERPDMTKLIDPISKNKDLQLYAIDQIRFEKPLPLYSLIAYSDSSQIVDLTLNVNDKGELKWTAPPGNWKLYALFQGWHGKLAERAGPGGEGDVIDHFSGPAIDIFLKHFDEIFKDYDLSILRAYFNDSYEVDDASGQADWTNDMFSEFRIRRGYDLAGHLPALFQQDDPDKNARILSDYRQTVADLILEKFTTHWTKWANRQGKLTRNQSHGSPGNILDLYAASDIPETEGRYPANLKFASSAANVTGKRFIACEAATWLNEHFISTLADVKEAADIFLLAGINHLFYHGTCYSPPDEPWPGFLFYAAVEFTPTNPLWNDFRALNNYITRVQSFMQQGRADNDVLLYFPIFDRYADYGRGMLEHFSGISPAYRDKPFGNAAETMLAKGFAYDYISDLQLTNTEVDKGLLYTEGNVYKTLIMPGSKYIPIETFSQILKLANDGAKIIVFGDLPENVAGMARLEAKTMAFNRFKASINFSATNNVNVMKATYGNGMILTGNDLEELLSFAGISRETMADNDIKFMRRENKSGLTWFVVNKGEKAFDGWLSLNTELQSIALFNPMTEEYGLAGRRQAATGNSEIYVRLMPEESLIISAYNSLVKGDRYPFHDILSTPSAIEGKWKIDFVSGGPSLPDPQETDKLISWTMFEGDRVKDFSGSAVYKINFKRPKAKADAYLLNLGLVKESASVSINGKEVATLLGPEFKVILDKKQVKSNNVLEIKVSNLMANRISYMDRNNIEWKKFYNVNMAARMRQNTKNGLFDASSWKPMDSGLLGPVTITPVNEVLR